MQAGAAAGKASHARKAGSQACDRSSADRARGVANAESPGAMPAVFPGLSVQQSGAYSFQPVNLGSMPGRYCLRQHVGITISCHHAWEKCMHANFVRLYSCIHANPLSCADPDARSGTGLSDDKAISILISASFLGYTEN